MLREITELTQLLPPGPYEVTIKDMQEEWGLTAAGTRRRLDLAVEAGTMKKRRAVVDGHICYAYSVD